MANEVILVVEDAPDVFESIQDHLSREGFSTISALTGEDASYKAMKQSPDLILLNVELPGVNGLEVYERLQSDERTQHIPIVLLGAPGAEAGVVTGLELGAEGYIAIPICPRDLLARVQAVLQREASTHSNDDSITLHELVMHPGDHELTISGKPIQLTFTEFSVLHCLARRPGWEFTRNQIVEAVRGEDYVVTERAVDARIASLRKKLGAAGQYIETVKGIGYRIRA
jgi:two-component system phosphate regulon response regulator PhoB